MQNTDRLCMGCMNDNSGEQICPICGYDNGAPHNPSFLPIRTWLNDRYLVGKVIDSNGEGATYLGWDNESNAVVRIREYFPTGLCERNSDGNVKITEGSEYSFNDGILSFIDLAKNLLRLKDLPGLLPVFDLFETNNTAYYIRGTIAGITLREFLLRNGGTLKWEQARSLFLPLLSTLKALHSAKIIHRGISPDTLIVGRDGKVRLAGFCIAAARTARSDMTAQLFPGFAAIEQYGFDGQQGPWTDNYGLAATLYRTLVGNPPPEATERVTNDSMSIPAKIAQSLPPEVLTALANALQILPEDRTQTMDEFRSELVPYGTGSVAINHKATENTPVKKKKTSSKKYVLIASIGTAVVLLAVMTILAFTVLKDVFFPQEPVNSGGMVEPPMSSLGTDYAPNNTEKLYAVPDFKGQTFAKVLNNIEHKEIFTFTIFLKGYNDDYKRGEIYEQNVAPDTAVKKGTEIQVKVSLGPANIKIPNLKGLAYEEAYVKLLELGFLSENIEKYEKYDASKSEGVVLDIDPAPDKSVSPDSAVKVYINSYKAPASSEPEVSSEPETSDPDNSSDDTHLSSDPSDDSSNTTSDDENLSSNNLSSRRSFWD